MGERTLDQYEHLALPINKAYKQRRAATLQETQWALNAIAYQSSLYRMGMVFDARGWERRRLLLIQFGRYVADVSFVVREKDRSFAFGTRIPANLDREWDTKELFYRHRRHIVMSIKKVEENPILFGINSIPGLMEDYRVTVGPTGEDGRWNLDVMGDLSPHVKWEGQTDDDGVHWDCAAGELAKMIRQVNK